jgi:hypothetical protein
VPDRLFYWLIGGLIQAVPLVQRYNANLRFRFARKLGDKLQQVAIRIVEVNRCGWDPPENARDVGGLPEEIAKLDPSLLDASVRLRSSPFGPAALRTLCAESDFLVESENLMFRIARSERVSKSFSHCGVCLAHA